MINIEDNIEDNPSFAFHLPFLCNSGLLQKFQSRMHTAILLQFTLCDYYYDAIRYIHVHVCSQHYAGYLQ